MLRKKKLPSKLKSLFEVVSALEMEDSYPPLSHFAAQIGFWVKVEEREREREREENDVKRMRPL